MSETVEVPFEGKAGDKATLLLAAAQELDLPSSVVRTTSGAFLVPEEVEKKAFGKSAKKSESEDEKPPAKKTAAKKSTSKKAQE